MIDTHSHLYAEEFDHDRDAMLVRAKQAGIERIYMPAIDSATHQGLMALAHSHPDYCIPMMGLHPCYVDTSMEKELQVVQEWLETTPFAAIGEVGLDFYHSIEFKDLQVEAFGRQIEMAISFDLPLVIHSRSSMDECIKMIATKGQGKVKGIFHCFGGDMRQAQRILELGFLLGIGGVVTYKNAGLAGIVEALPLESFVLETDAPYLSPVPYRGKRNETAYMTEVAQKMASIKGVDLTVVSEITTANAKKIFRF